LTTAAKAGYDAFRNMPSRRARDRLMRSQLVAPFLARVQAAGKDPLALLERVGLPRSAASAGEVEMPLHTLHAFLDAVEQATGDAFVGLHVAESLPRGTYGLLEFCSRSAPNIREALARLARLITLMNEVVVVTFSEEDGAGILQQRVPGEPACVGRHGNEFFIAQVLLQGRALTGAPYVPRHVWFAHGAPPDPGPLRALCRTDAISFGAGANGIELDRDTVEIPLATSDPPLLSLLEQVAERQMQRRAGRRRLLGDVEARIREQLTGGAPSLEGVAEALKMSRRTLQRHLAGEGVSFQQLTDGVRRELACRWLHKGERPIGEVAFLLGYTEMSAFFRAFKRWTGATPTEYRDGAK
jgi:AraC-like DNA-binding protein